MGLVFHKRRKKPQRTRAFQKVRLLTLFSFTVYSLTFFCPYCTLHHNAQSYTQCIRELLATSVRGESEVPPATAPPKPILLPTAEVLSHVSAEALAKRKAANIEGTRTAGSLGAVAW